MLQTYAIENAVDKGNRDAVSNLDLAELFQQHHPRIYNYLRYRVNAPEDAEDLTSIIFERAFKKRRQYDPAKGTFSAWLFRIADNELISYYRKRTKRSAWETETEIPVDLVTSDPSPEAHFIKKEGIVQLLQSLERLSERDQEIISLKFAGRLRNTEIGQIMQMKEKTVSVALLRAVRRLRQEMEKEGA